MENRPATLRSRRVCRFCLTESEPLNYIYDRDISRPFQVPLPLQIMSCVGIEVYAADGMPQMICNTCRWNLDRSYKFKTQCKKADEALRNYPVSGVLPRPFPPISNDPPDINNKRMAEQRGGNDQQKKARLDNGDRERRDRQVEKQSKDEQHDLYDEDQERGSEGENELINNEKEERKLEPGEIRVHACNQCDRTFPLRQALIIHVQRAHRDRNFKCTECDRQFFSKYDLSKHMSTHSEEKPYTCQICHKQFSRANLLQRHEKIHRDELRYGCQHCDREFFTTDELEKHEETVHKAVKPFQCNICNKRFTYKQGLERHEMLHSEDKTFVCEYCKEAFRTSTKLARHLTTHAGHRPYLCKLCPRSFLLSHHLTRHMRSHSVEKRHVCEDCGKAFKRKESLEVHQLTHSKRSGLGLTCDVCQETCRNRADYVTHIKQHIEAGEKMGPDGLPAEAKDKMDFDSEEDEDDEPYSDGDDDYEPPSSISKKRPKPKSSFDNEDDHEPEDKDDLGEKIVYVRGKDGTMVKKTIKTLMPIQRRDLSDTTKVRSPPHPGKTPPPVKQEGRADETEAQVQKIVESVFKEHKIPLKSQVVSSSQDQGNKGQRLSSTTSDKVEATATSGTPKPMNTVKVIKRIVVRKPTGSNEVTKESDTTQGVSQSTPQTPGSGPKVTKRVIVRRIIRQGDTTKEVIMNPDGTIIDPVELAKLPTGNVVKRVVVKKPLDKSQNLVQSMIQSAELKQSPTNLESTDSLKFELKTKQGSTSIISSVEQMNADEKINQTIASKEQETIQQLQKTVVQQELKIKELEARKQQHDYEGDDMLPERHDESEDEQQLPLKRVFVKRKQSIYDEEREYDDTKVSTDDSKPEINDSGDTGSPEIQITKQQSNKPSITSSKVYDNKKIILLKPDEQSVSQTLEDSEISQMNQELCNILDSTDNIVKMQETALNNLTQISGVSVDGNSRNGKLEKVSEPIEDAAAAATAAAAAAAAAAAVAAAAVAQLHKERENDDAVNEQTQVNEQSVPEDEKMELDEPVEEHMTQNVTDKVENEQHDEIDNIQGSQDSTLTLSANEMSNSVDIFDQSDSVEGSQKNRAQLGDSVIELSAGNDTINLNDTHDSRDSLEDKLSQMEG